MLKIDDLNKSEITILIPKYELFDNEGKIVQWVKANLLHRGFDVYIFRMNINNIGVRSGFVVGASKNDIPKDILDVCNILEEHDKIKERILVKLILPKHNTVSYGKSRAGYGMNFEKFYNGTFM